jgi:hypothetical protein
MSTTGVALVSYLPAASVLGAGLTALKLLKTGLYRKYPAFFVSLLVPIPCLASLIFLPLKSDAYFYIWAATQPVEWFFYIAMVFELYRLILARHKGLYSLGRWAMYAGIGISMTISALALLPHITPQMPQFSKGGNPSAVNYLNAGERGVDCSLAIFLLFMMFLLSWYAVPLCRNVVVHAVIYTVFFLSSTLGQTLRSVFGLKNIDALNTGLMAMSCVCLLAWFFLLTRDGEEVRVKQPWIGREQEERILSQLDSMNAALLRTTRN